jgi:hypothetical protein
MIAYREPLANLGPPPPIHRPPAAPLSALSQRPRRGCWKPKVILGRLIYVNQFGQGPGYDRRMAWPPPARQPPVTPPGPLPPPAQPSDGIGWALVPLLTVGVGAPFSFVFAGARRQSRALKGAGLAYGIALTVATDAATISHGWIVTSILLGLTWVVSTLHAIIVRPKVFRPVDPRDQLNNQVVEVAKHRRSLRESARRIAADDPGLAHELRIGRPDLLPRAFDDGGLIDVNHAPPQSLSLLPGLTYDMVERILQVRAAQGGFISVEDLAVHADLPAAIVAGIAEYAIFIP